MIMNVGERRALADVRNKPDAMRSRRFECEPRSDPLVRWITALDYNSRKAPRRVRHAARKTAQQAKLLLAMERMPDAATIVSHANAIQSPTRALARHS